MNNETSTITEFYVESPDPEDDDADTDIVDFALLANGNYALLTAIGILRVLLRLISDPPASKYVLITNQPPSINANELNTALGSRLDDGPLLDMLVRLAKNSPAVRDQISKLGQEELIRLRNWKLSVSYGIDARCHWLLPLRMNRACSLSAVYGAIRQWGIEDTGPWRLCPTTHAHWANPAAPIGWPVTPRGCT